MIRKVPRSSVTALREPSINAGLVTSTTTPGSTPPEESVTVPRIVADWAHAVAGANTSSPMATAILTICIANSWSVVGPLPRGTPRVLCEEDVRRQLLNDSSVESIYSNEYAERNNREQTLTARQPAVRSAIGRPRI